MKKRLKGASTWLSAFFHPHASGCGVRWHGLRFSPPKPAMPANRFSEEQQCLKKIGQIFIIGKAPIQILEKYPRVAERDKSKFQVTGFSVQVTNPKNKRTVASFESRKRGSFEREVNGMLQGWLII